MSIDSTVDFALENRADVRSYTVIPQFFLRFLPRGMLERMYAKAMKEAVCEYETPAMSGISLDFRLIAIATVGVEKEIVRRGLERKPLNPHEEDSPKVYATDIWSRV